MHLWFSFPLQEIGLFFTFSCPTWLSFATFTLFGNDIFVPHLQVTSHKSVALTHHAFGVMKIGIALDYPEFIDELA